MPGKVHAQKGFTLIELMVVVAIIGVLAMIVISAEQSYISRSQVARLVGELSSLKIAVEDHMVHDKSFSSLGELGYTASDLTADAAVVVDVNAGTVFITATLNGNVSLAVEGAVIAISRGANGVWSCDISPSSSLSWDNSFVPTACQAL